VSLPLRRFPAGSFASPPTVSLVIPNLCHDMHDCPVAAGDAWLRTHLRGYARWAMTHDSLLIVTWDADDGSGSNRKPGGTARSRGSGGAAEAGWPARVRLPVAGRRRAGDG